MSANLIIHSPHSINCNKFLNQFLQRNRHYKHYKSFLIPYFCREVDHNSHIISGNFVWPMWNTLERTILSKGAKFTYSYITGKDFIIEYYPQELNTYQIYGLNNLSKNYIYASKVTLQPSSILLFPIDCAVAKPLIENHLL